MFCPKCGEKVSEQDAFCGSCGYSLKGQQAENNTAMYDMNVSSERKSRLVAGLLQIFLPGLAVGRFYLGYTQIAIIQILVSIVTCGIGAIWPVIDGILIIVGKVPTDANGTPLRD